uniref:Uncharacterized protein n=1 Tax=Caenorhabditis tropicalis TaxID=1561998 RepID=A0A1I7T6I6_9PELO
MNDEVDEEWGKKENDVDKELKAFLISASRFTVPTIIPRLNRKFFCIADVFADILNLFDFNIRVIDASIASEKKKDDEDLEGIDCVLGGKSIGTHDGPWKEQA